MSHGPVRALMQPGFSYVYDPEFAGGPAQVGTVRARDFLDDVLTEFMDSSFNLSTIIPAGASTNFLVDAFDDGATNWDTMAGALTYNGLGEFVVDTAAAGGGISYGPFPHIGGGITSYYLRFKVTGTVLPVSDTATLRTSVRVCNNAGTGSVTASDVTVLTEGVESTIEIAIPAPNAGLYFQVEIGMATADGWTAGATVIFSEAMLHSGSSPDDFFSRFDTQSDARPNPAYLSGYYEGMGNHFIVAADHAWYFYPSFTQLVTNPFAAVDLAGRTAGNGVGARVTTESLFGPAAYRLTASAANARDRSSISVTNGAKVELKAIIRNTAAATRTAELHINGVAVVSFNLAAGGLLQLDGIYTPVATGAVNFDVVWTNSAAGEIFYHYYVGATESGGYPIPPVPKISAGGTIMPPHEWAGTAHASESSGVAGSIPIRTSTMTGIPYYDQNQVTILARAWMPAGAPENETDDHDFVLFETGDHALRLEGVRKENTPSGTGVREGPAGDTTLTVEDASAINAVRDYALTVNGTELVLRQAVNGSVTVQRDDAVMDRLESELSALAYIGGPAPGGDAGHGWAIKQVMILKRAITDSEFLELHDQLFWTRDTLRRRIRTKLRVAKVRSNRLRIRVAEIGEADG